MTELSKFKFAIPLLVLAMLPMSGPAQAAQPLSTGAGAGIGQVCQSTLAAIARQPEQAEDYIEAGIVAVERILDLAKPNAKDKAIGIGMITGGYIEAIARNPSHIAELALVAEACETILEEGVVVIPDLP